MRSVLSLILAVKARRILAPRLLLPLLRGRRGRRRRWSKVLLRDRGRRRRSKVLLRNRCRGWRSKALLWNWRWRRSCKARGLHRRLLNRLRTSLLEIRTTLLDRTVLEPGPIYWRSLHLRPIEVICWRRWLRRRPWRINTTRLS